MMETARGTCERPGAAAVVTRVHPSGMRVPLTHLVDSRARTRLAERTDLPVWPGPYPVPVDALVTEFAG